MKHVPILALVTVLVMAALAGCVAGCGGDGKSLLPQITITHPDGSVETRTDTQAVAMLFDSLNGLVDRIERYEARKAEAQAAGDKDEADYWDRLITIGERELERRAAAKPATPAPVAQTPTSPVGGTAP